jgi:DNA-binding response OmpR family regulator
LKKRILVLDDHQAILEVVTEALRYEDFEVLGLSLGRELFDSVGSFQPDLVLLDYKLADTNGGDLCRQLKASAAHCHIRVIVFSAYFSPGDIHRPGGCDDILFKPFDLVSLLSAVNGQLEAMSPKTTVS